MEVKNYQYYTKNRDSFGIGIKFPTKLQRDIFRFLLRFFLQVKGKKIQVFGKYKFDLSAEK